MSQKRPISAPATRTLPQSTNNTNNNSSVNFTTNTTYANTMSTLNTAEGMNDPPEPVYAFTDNDVPNATLKTQNSRKGNHSMRTRPSTANNTTTHTIETTPSFKKSLYNITAGELEKLREIVASKDEIITKLSRKLSHARAYPLKGAALDPSAEVYSDDEPIKPKNNPLQSTNKQTFNNANDDDVYSETESFLAEEEACHEKRVHMALDIQRMKNERSAKKKAANPPHIRAIREAKSFAESVTEKFNNTR